MHSPAGGTCSVVFPFPLHQLHNLRGKALDLLLRSETQQSLYGFEKEMINQLLQLNVPLPERSGRFRLFIFVFFAKLQQKKKNRA